MIIDRKIPVIRVVQSRWRLLAIATTYTVVVVYLQRTGHKWVDTPVAIPAMLGTVLSVLLAFRTAAAYDRWWEARKVWGGIVNDSRTFARQVLTLIDNHGDTPSQQQRELVYRQIAWTYSLTRSLRGQDAVEDVEQLLDAGEVDRLRVQQNVPNALLMTQGKHLREAYNGGSINAYFLASIEDTLRRLTDHMGKCERIKKTVFPMYYSYFLSRALFVFFLLLPSGLAPFLGWLTVPIALIIEFMFSLVDLAGRVLQDPFENRPSDPPIMAISRTIDINLRQQLGESTLPKPIVPVDGVLM